MRGVRVTDHSKLTRRELQIIILLAMGLAYKDVASVLGLTLYGVRVKVSQMLSKTGTRNGTHLVAAAMAGRFFMRNKPLTEEAKGRGLDWLLEWQG